MASRLCISRGRPAAPICHQRNCRIAGLLTTTALILLIALVPNAAPAQTAAGNGGTGSSSAGNTPGGLGGTGDTGLPGNSAPNATSLGNDGAGGGGGGAAGGGTGGNGGSAAFPGAGGAGGAAGVAGITGQDGDTGIFGGQLLGGGGGGGGGGGLHGFNGASIPGGILSGGNGGAGGNGGNGLPFGGGGGGGGGGAGGYGAVVTGATANVNTSTITAGNGGVGGNAGLSPPSGGSTWVGGSGGAGGGGGIGILFTASGASLSNSGSIQGGNGGAGGALGVGTPSGTAGSPGSGGAGIVGSGLTILNSGTISGGLSGDGVTRADAIVFTGGTNFLGGTGTVGSFTMTSGGTFAPGNGTPGSSMTVSGNLAFASGAIYLLQLNPSTASFATVTGSATLGGATVNANFASGSYVSKQYTILTATGGISGTFGALANTNLPQGASDSLSYDANSVFLNLKAGFTNFTGLNVNQQNVANALTNFFNATGRIPATFFSLSPAGLTQVSGELGTGAQQTTFDAMNLFMGLLTDPFVAGRGGSSTPGASAPPGYASTGYSAAQATGAARDAYAMFTKAPPAAYDPHWSVWGAGFGGSQTTDGNAALGSNTATSSIYGTAIGADYRISPFTVAGFALAGGGTNFSVAGSGSGHSDLFQAGAFIRHTVGPAYVSAALAYGWQDVTTNRTVTAAGSDQLRAQFDANAFSGRLEGGYRYNTPWVGGIGITPYAAAQFTTFDLPAYAEQAIVGTNNFALAYGAKDATDSRSELGLRTDKSWAMIDGILTLRGRLAWAHDFNPDRSIASTFQTLPGASFVVNGAAQASDSALVTASVEKKWLNGWSAAATFEGEFSEVTRSYAGKGVVRYTW
jgi:uncharacterized protein with beta-barrel porin domain